jgi:hypothetical protein
MVVALVGVVLLAGTWFTVLRPKAGDDVAQPTPVTAPTAPGQQGLETAVGKANGAVQQSQQSAQATQDAVAQAGGDTAAPGTTGSTPASPAKAGASRSDDPSAPLLAQLGKGKTVILLFWNPEFDEDRFAYKSVRRADEADGRVIAKSARISDVSRYEAVTTGVQVLTTPTVVVIGPDRKAVSRTGYVERKTVEQLIGDSRRPR